MSEKLYSGSTRVTDVELEKAIQKNRRKNIGGIVCILLVCFFFLGWWWLPWIGKWPIVIVRGGTGTGVGLVLPLTHFLVDNKYIQIVIKESIIKCKNNKINDFY